MRVRAIGIPGVLLAVLGAQAMVAAPAPATTPASVCGSMVGVTPAITKVMWIIMENTSYGTGVNQIPGAPNPSANYIDGTLIPQCGSASNYHAASHPSFPNYLAVTSGSTQGQSSDRLGYFAGPSIFSQADPSWRSYTEFMPTNCDHFWQTGDATTHQYYVGRHNPASDYSSLPVGAPAGDCATNDVPLGSTSTGALLSDAQGGTLPSFSSLIPGLCNDMHNFPTTDPGCPDPVKGGDNWLATWIPIITAGADYTAGHLVIDVVWDEGRTATGITPVSAGGDCTTSSTPDCIVPNLVISPYTAHVVSATNFSHYSLLRTTEHLLGLSYLGHAIDASSTDMCGDFSLCQVTPGPPRANFVSSCVLLACSFDGTSSTASSGSIASYSWDFGDGTAGTGPSPTHTYLTAGPYTVTLTVADDLAATGSVSNTVTVSTQSSAISFVAGTSTTGNASQESLTTPVVVTGDSMLLFGSAAGTTALTGPAGWQQVTTTTAKGMVTTLWSKIATAADSGLSVTVGFGKVRRGAVQLLAYNGTSATAPVAAFAAKTTLSTTTSTTPMLTLASPGWVVSYWAAKSSTITSWVVPAGQLVRATAAGTGGGHITSASSDAGAASPPGSVGAVTATTAVAQGSGTSWTVILAPGP